MNVVDQIIDKTQFTEEIDGLEFKLRIITAETAARVIGNKTLGLMRAGSTTGKMSEGETARISKGYLQQCMVSPKLADVSDPESDAICVEDLGDFAEKILMIVFKRSGFETLGNVKSSSEVTEAETSAKP